MDAVLPFYACLLLVAVTGIEDYSFRRYGLLTAALVGWLVYIATR